MKKTRKIRCAPCNSKECKKEGKDCYDKAEEHLQLYKDEKILKILKASASIEARHYCSETRLSETILFAQEMGVKKLGLAFCVGLSTEAKAIEKIFKKHFEVVSVCCKVSGINKRELNLDQIKPDAQERICNPAGQAALLNQEDTDLNVLCGLCVGHDSIFNMKSNAPVTTLITKDRVLAHNPIGAIYCQYISRKF
jgi:uncharacterized metal-binding protein